MDCDGISTPESQLMELPYNILWIMTDQQRYDYVSCFGQDYVATPNIDSIAGQGVCFDRHYSSSPLCAPARASLATGRYSHNCQGECWLQ
jgi:arylsulfatase A-like enzyme